MVSGPEHGPNQLELQLSNNKGLTSPLAKFLQYGQSFNYRYAKIDLDMALIYE